MIPLSTALLATISGEWTAKLPLFARIGGGGEIPVTAAAALRVLVKLVFSYEKLLSFQALEAICTEMKYL